MKYFIKQEKQCGETEVHVLCYEKTEEVLQIEKFLQSMETSIEGRWEGIRKRIRLSEIYYVDSVDKRTYIYSQDQVIEVSEKLYQLEEMLKDSGFVCVRKNCIINKYKLKEIRMTQNSHIEATLLNGERILVTRKYIPDIKKAFLHG